MLPHIGACEAVREDTERKVFCQVCVKYHGTPHEKPKRIKATLLLQTWRRPTNYGEGNNIRPLNLGLVLPHSIYKEREYNKAVSKAISDLQRSKKPELEFLEKFEFGLAQVHRIMMKVNPSPTGVLLL
jgi:hypothetical protein